MWIPKSPVTRTIVDAHTPAAGASLYDGVASSPTSPQKSNKNSPNNAQVPAVDRVRRSRNQLSGPTGEAEPDSSETT